MEYRLFRGDRRRLDYISFQRELLVRKMCTEEEENDEEDGDGI